MQELNSAFPALIPSFIPCSLQSTGVVKSCPGLSLWVRETTVIYWLCCAAVALEKMIFFLAVLHSVGDSCTKLQLAQVAAAHVLVAVKKCCISRKKMDKGDLLVLYKLHWRRNALIKWL